MKELTITIGSCFDEKLNSDSRICPFASMWEGVCAHPSIDKPTNISTLFRLPRNCPLKNSKKRKGVKP